MMGDFLCPPPGASASHLPHAGARRGMGSSGRALGLCLWRGCSGGLGSVFGTGSAGRKTLGLGPNLGKRGELEAAGLRIGEERFHQPPEIVWERLAGGSVGGPGGGLSGSYAFPRARVKT